MRLTSRTVEDGFYWGVIQGATAWTIYAIVECSFASILPWMTKPGYEYIPLHPGFTALLFGLYPIIGSVLGGLAGLWLRGAKSQFLFSQKVQPMIFFPAFATFSVVLAYAISFAVNYSGSLSLSALPPLFISLFLMIALLLSAGSSTWFIRLRFLANPWTASIVLLGLPWINREVFGSSPLIVKAAAALVYPAIVFSLSFYYQKIATTRRNGQFTTSVPVASGRSFLFLTSAILVVLGISLFLKQKPLVFPHEFKSADAAANRPNVLLIVMDTVRADHLSLYGYESDTTPNLRKFVEKATLYTRAIAPSDMTLPSHASIFTGIYGLWHKAHYDAPRLPEGRPLDEGFHTLTEILSEKGYFTIAVVANTAYLRHDFGFNQGFQHYDQRTAVPFLHETQPYYIRQGIRNALTHLFSPSTSDQRYIRAEDINKEAFACLDKANRNRIPFFLFINYMDAHEPYIPPSPFDTYFPGKKPNFTLKNYFQLQEDVMRREREITNMEYRHLLSQYDGGIAYIDYHINELIERLKALDLYDNTLFIITSDHGEVFGEREIIGHASSVYQDQVYVPLIIKYPGLNKGLVADTLVSLVDLMPTALDVLGFDIPEEIQGESLLKVEVGKPRIVFSESFPNPTYIKWHSRFNRTERAMFSGVLKFVGSTAGKKELYDLSMDPGEKKNLYMMNHDAARELETRLSEWINVVKEESASPVKLKNETIDRLKSLGYIK